MSDKKILLVDDLVLVQGLTNKLRTRGFTVVSANDGGKTIKRVREDNPDLLILDINFSFGLTNNWDAFSILA